MLHRLIPILLIVASSLLARGDSAQTNVTILVPGFIAQEIPIKLSNINNLRFRPDGTLTALGYDGRVHLLRDRNGDGLEDDAKIFWDQPTLRVPVGMVWAKEGLYVSSQGKVSLLRDTNGDDQADVEEIVASGWPRTDVGSGGVDATAVTRDREGNLYFGLLTADYSNPYRVKNGVSFYNLESQRGTIQKWSVASKKLETIATGIRVPYTLAFNRHGDLFLTDQEGETWCPEGNPLDELNHIIPGLNYGFPPRHEKHLPNLISEPPVVGFGPQHQSTCGFVFNEASRGQKAFGPLAWEGDAFVTGESRGKIWRARLSKTQAGYLGRETLFARLNMLTTDVAISPRGELYVSCHSGAPDWGTGPTGEGKLFKIIHQDSRAPQPVAIWPSNPMEVQVAFDQPIDASISHRVAAMGIEFGDFVSAADRLETLKPPYQVVKNQELTLRGKIRVISARLSSDRRTLSLTTDPHPQSVRYSLTLPGVKASGSKSAEATVDLGYDLSGVEAAWTDRQETGSPRWKGWLPHLNWNESARFAGATAEHQRLTELVRRKGQLQLRTRLALPPGKNSIRIQASAPFNLRHGEKTEKSQSAARGVYALQTTLLSTAQPAPLAITLETGASKVPKIEATYFSDSDPTVRPIPFQALLLPWAPTSQPPPVQLAEKTEITGGDFERGRDLFFGERLKCATCHRVRGEGGLSGPDLSNLIHRDAAGVLRDIREPSATINPDYVAYNLRLRDGEELTGFVRTHSDGSLRFSASDGQEKFVDRRNVVELQPSTISLMPTDLLQGLKDSQVRDLLTYLLYAPPSRSRAEVSAMLTAGKAQANHPQPSERKPLRVVLVASKQDHGPGQHDYPAWQKKWHGLFETVPGLQVTNAWEWPNAEQWQTADVVVLYFWNHNWSKERYQQLDEYQARGGGLAIFHSATIADNEAGQLAARIGLAAQPGPTKYLHAPLVLNFSANTNHPITKGFKSLNLLDEPYWPMIGDTNQVQVLATAEMEGKQRPLIWTFQKEQGRVFASIMGHYTWTFDDPLFRILALRGIAWTAGDGIGGWEHFFPLTDHEQK